jgi:hypothetical protein
MTRKTKFPPGWDEARVQRLIAHYEQQGEDEQVAEDEAAQQAPGQTLVAVPAELLPSVRGLLGASNGCHREASVYPLNLYPSGSQRLAFLCPALTTMFSIMDRYIEKFDRKGQMDRPYFYNERATLSVFAGAIWRSHPSNLVLEEYCAEKTWPGGRYKGRFDIWFAIENQSCYAEAKQSWPAVSAFDAEEGQEIINLLRAEADVSQDNVRDDLKKGSVDHALSIVFVTPLIPKRKRTKAESSFATFDRILNEHLQALTLDGSYNVLRGSYLRRDLLTDDWFASLQPGVRIYPGVEVLICERQPIPDPAAALDQGAAAL